MTDYSGDAPTSSVVLDPVESLSFQLQPGASPQAVLTIRNISDSRKIAFKVKTTRPMRYLVRPNQGMLGPNMNASIMVILQQKDCDELLRLDPAERQLSNDKFLVQSSYVDDSFYEVVKTKSAKEMADELTNMWAKADKKSLANKKLRCRFTEEQDGTNASSGSENAGGAATLAADAAMATWAESEEALHPMASTARQAAQPDLSASTRHDQLTSALLNPSPAKPAAHGGAVDDERGDEDDTSEPTIESVAGLKKKYDELVQFTVQLTASRQSVMNDLERTRVLLEQANEAAQRVKKENESTLRQRKQPNGGGSSIDTHANADRALAANATTTFGLYHLLVCAIIFFLIGRFY